MKKIVLPLVASLFAVAGAFASIKLAALPPEFIQLHTECRQVSVGCSNDSGPTCLVNSESLDGLYVVYSLRTTPTTCAQPKKHNGWIIDIP